MKVKARGFLLLIALGLIFTGPLMAQETDPDGEVDTDSLWNTEGTAGFNFSQVGLHNWAGGGQSSVAVTGKFAYVATRTSRHTIWKNYIDVAYGVLRTEQTDEFRKTDDMLILGTSWARKVTKHWSISTLAEFRSQLSPGYNYTDIDGTDQEQRTLISDILSPGYLNTSIGAQYTVVDKLSLLLSPISGKTTFVRDDQLSDAGAYGVDPGKHVRFEFGALINFKYQAAPMENVSYLSNLNLFSAYETFGNVDVNWEQILGLKVNKWLISTVSTNLIYDDDVTVTRDDGTRGRDLQWKYVINVGVVYSF